MKVGRVAYANDENKRARFAKLTHVKLGVRRFAACSRKAETDKYGHDSWMRSSEDERVHDLKMNRAHPNSVPNCVVEGMCNERVNRDEPSSFGIQSECSFVSYVRPRANRLVKIQKCMKQPTYP